MLFIGVLIVTLVVVCSTYVGVRHFSTAKANDANGDWSMFMGDIARSGLNTTETTITPATAVHLNYAGRFATGGYVVATPAFSNGVMYEGSWDGYEYAIDATTHTLLWKQFLGITVQKKYCYSKSVGVTSSAAISNGMLYVGGGDGYLYALNTSDGSVVWKTLLGNPPYYNFSSPVVYNNKIYIGLAAFCDPPYVQGKVESFDAATGTLVASTALTSGSQTGAPVWSSLAIDASTNTVFATTGNNGSKTINYQPLAEAIVSFDADTLAVKSSWQIPASQQISDSDFGATPTLFDVNGGHYIGVMNKNGIYYVLDRNNLPAGPVWEQAAPGTPQADDYVSASCYMNGTLYVAGGATAINGQQYGGTISALDAATGAVKWSQAMLGQTVSSTLCVNTGLVVDNQGNVVEVRNATNGTILYRHTTMRRVEGTSVIYNGELYTPSTDSNIWFFKLKL